MRSKMIAGLLLTGLALGAAGGCDDYDDFYFGDFGYGWGGGYFADVIYYDDFGWGGFYDPYWYDFGGYWW